MGNPFPHEATVRLFPLVPRAKPTCHPLNVRVCQAADLADTAAGNPADNLKTAAEACNLGALIASDCGLPRLARYLCQAQFRMFHDARPHDAATAKLALQSLINLARLHARDGDGITAYRDTQALFTAVRHRQAGIIDGTRIDFSDLTRTAEDHREILQWLWTVFLADGTRALAQAGKWTQALQHVRDHHGISQSLLDGRQIAIIAHHAAGDHQASERLLSSTAVTASWEQAVAACLAMLTGNPHRAATTADSYLTLDRTAPQVVFRTRLGLAILDLTGHRHALRLAHAIEADVLQTQDAYAAKEILTRAGPADPFTMAATRTLTGLVEAAGLDAGSMPAQILEHLTAAMTRAEAALLEAIRPAR
jgi:hypothetical protein